MILAHFLLALPAAILRDLWAFFLDPAEWSNDTNDEDPNDA